MSKAAFRGSVEDGDGGDRQMRQCRFANEVQEESGAGITADLADVLIERADRIRSVLACR
jgi:hypothetical protein